jgi:hypothetical protein
MRILSTKVRAERCKGCRKWLTDAYEFIENMHLQCIREMSLDEIKKSGKSLYGYKPGDLFNAVTGVDVNLWRQWEEWMQEAREEQERQQELQLREQFANVQYELLLDELGLKDAFDYTKPYGHNFLTGRGIIYDEFGGSVLSYHGVDVYISEGARTHTAIWDREIIRNHYLDIYYRRAHAPTIINNGPREVSGSVQFIYADTDSEQRSLGDWAREYGMTIDDGNTAHVPAVRKKTRTKRSKVTEREDQLSKLLEVRPLTEQDRNIEIKMIDRVKPTCGQGLKTKLSELQKRF